MKIDIRAEAAKYYDFLKPAFDDVSFYKKHTPSHKSSILELGCGTGRVLIPLAEECGYIHGIDGSPAMLDVCKAKMKNAGLPDTKAKVEVSDITNFDLGRTFDLIIAPFRVIQNLETNEQLDGLFDCIRNHLSPEGTCILNAFKPYKDPDGLQKEWDNPDEIFLEEIPIEEGALMIFERRPRMNKEMVIIYPELIIRKYENDKMVDEAIMKICMRCFYPEEFEKIITSHGFTIIDKWGGYSNEKYGEGPELVVQFVK
jgi:SAM-dependent methyltransferase